MTTTTDYETIVVNLSGKSRRKTYLGREYLVVDATLLAEGVLNGSRGPLYYSPEEIAANPGMWNHIPIVGWHPKDKDGNPTLARHPEILEEYGLGLLFNDQYNPENRTRSAEAWFDIERTEKFDRRLKEQFKIMPRLRAGQPIELSTGLFTDNIPSSGVFNTRDGRSKAYSHIAKNYRPDHLAALPDQRGACSNEDGCGFNVNVLSALDSVLLRVDNSKIDWKKIGDDLSKKGLMPGYGQIFLNDENEDTASEVWYVGGDGDEKGFSKTVEDIFKSLGVQKVYYEAESFPPKDQSWVQVYPQQRAWTTMNTAQDEEDDSTFLGRVIGSVLNAMGYQPRSMNTGQFKRYGAGYGKDPEHAAAQHGAMILTTEDHDVGKLTKTEIEVQGHNPVSWVMDEGIWEKAKKAAREGGKYAEGTDQFWAVVAHIYKNMGGRKKPTHNEEPPQAPPISETPTTYTPLEDEPMVTENADMEECPKCGKMMPKGGKCPECGYEAMPKTTNSEVLDMEPKNDKVRWLVTNCECWKGKEAALNAMSEAELDSWKKFHEKARKNEQVINNLSEFGLTVNSAGQVEKSWAGVIDFKDAAVRDAVCRDLFGMTANEATVLLGTAKKVHDRERFQLVHKLTANITDDKAREAKARDLLQRQTEDLELLVSLMPNQPTPLPTHNSDGKPDEYQQFMQHFFGGGSREGAQGGPVPLNNRGTSDADDKPDVDDVPRQMPTMNYDEISPTGVRLRKVRTGGVA